jgi:ribosome-associated protein
MSERIDDFDEEWEWDENFKSKTQVKNELNELKELGRELINMPVADLDKLELPGDIYDNALKAKK